MIRGFFCQNVHEQELVILKISNFIIFIILYLYKEKNLSLLLSMNHKIIIRLFYERKLSIELVKLNNDKN